MYILLNDGEEEHGPCGAFTPAVGFAYHVSTFY
jgi:hypothetical protein